MRHKVLKIKSLFLCMGIISSVYGEDIDTLLNDFSQKNALSQSTIDKNKGHLLLYTRERLENMHAKTLKDVLKTIPVLQYTENRYGLPDPLSMGGAAPYSSNLLRLYIDGVEITQGWMGSGVIQYGDINIDFVDHIELYAIPPSFAASVEPAYMTIFIYSKTPERDSGGQLSLIVGSRGENTQTLNYGDEKDGVSYMVNLSHTVEKRKKVDNDTVRPLSRNYDRTQIFSYVKTDNQSFHLQLINKKSDTLAGLSYDATPLVSQMNNLNVHVDYSIQLSEVWKAQFAYDYLNTDLDQEDNIPLITSGATLNTFLRTKTKNSTYSAELTYSNVIGKHHIALGAKGRVKKLDSLYLENNVYNGDFSSAFNKETILSLFFQEQYELSSNELLTLGVKYSNISRNALFDDDNLFQLRLGYLYNDDTWSYKAYLFRNMFTIDPFSRYFSLNPFKNIEPQVTVGITQEFSYSNKDSEIRLMMFFLKEKDNLLDIQSIENTESLVNVLTYDYTIDKETQFNLQFSYSRYFDVVNIGDVDAYNSYLMFSKSYGDLDIYNGLVWNYRTYDKKHHFDWTSSISWNASEDLTFTLKGENLLNKAKTYDIFRINPLTGSFMDPLKVSPIDQRIMLEMEYLF